MKTFNELELRVIRWAEARKIIPDMNSGQVMHQFTSMVDDLNDAHCGDNKEGVKHSIGHAMAILIVYCDLNGLSIRECLNQAYDQFKNVKGVAMSDGSILLNNQ